MGRNQTNFGIRSGRQSCICDTIAHGDFAYTLANSLHDTGTFHSRDSRQGWEGISSGPMVYIDKIQSDGFMPYQRFTRCRLSGIEILPAHHFRPSGFMYFDRFRHNVFSFSNFAVIKLFFQKVGLCFMKVKSEAFL
jgi:hypothetical protein